MKQDLATCVEPAIWANIWPRVRGIVVTRQTTHFTAKLKRGTLSYWFCLRHQKASKIGSTPSYHVAMKHDSIIFYNHRSPCNRPFNTYKVF